MFQYLKDKARALLTFLQTANKTLNCLQRADVVSGCGPESCEDGIPAAKYMLSSMMSDACVRLGNNG